jgi:hypothetical protein
MKRFLIFAGFRYYPDGGMSDYRGAYDSFEQARAAVDTLLIPADEEWSKLVGEPIKYRQPVWAEIAENTDGGLKLITTLDGDGDNEHRNLNVNEDGTWTIKYALRENPGPFVSKGFTERA